MIGDDLSDEHGLFSGRMCAHRLQRPVGIFGPHKHNDPALVGDQQRIQSEERAGCSHVVGHGHRGFNDLHHDTGRVSDLVERRRNPTARGVTHHGHLGARVEQRCDDPVERLAVGHDVGPELESVTHTEHRDAVRGDRT